MLLALSRWSPWPSGNWRDKRGLETHGLTISNQSLTLEEGAAAKSFRRGGRHWPTEHRIQSCGKRVQLESLRSSCSTRRALASPRPFPRDPKLLYAYSPPSPLLLVLYEDDFISDLVLYEDDFISDLVAMGNWGKVRLEQGARASGRRRRQFLFIAYCDPYLGRRTGTEFHGPAHK
jgi:hypothetical protein